MGLKSAKKASVSGGRVGPPGGWDPALVDEMNPSKCKGVKGGHWWV